MTDFTDYTDQARSANTAVAESLRQAKDITLASVGVFQSLTSVMVPLSVAMLPGSEKLVPTIDTVVERSFDTLVKVVDAQYQFGVAALDRLAALPTSL